MEQNIISDRIKMEYQKGATQTELAEKYGISHTHIWRLISGKSDDMNMKLSVVKKMFPKATLSLDGQEYDATIIENYKVIVENIKKLIKDPNFSDEKKIKIIEAFLD